MARVAAFLLLVAVAGNLAFADPVLDQSFTPSLPTDRVANVGQSNLVDWGQTFTVGLTGTLTSFEIAVRTAAAGATNPLLVDLRTTTGGVPTTPDAGANVLFSTTVSSGIGTTFTTLTFAPGLSVVAGDVLAIVLRSNDPAIPGVYEWPGTAAGGYAGGAAHLRLGSGAWGTSTSIGDLWFRTFVDPGTTTPVPEPALAALLAAGLGLVALRRRRTAHPG
jgi:hypothetical protein